MSTALALMQQTEYDLMSKLATIAFKSGYTQQNEAQLLFVMAKGFEIGVSPMQALDGIQVIKGKTTVSPQLMLALINRSGLIEDMKIDGDATQCTVTMQRKGRSAHTETFTMGNAQSMGLAGNYNWKAQPATMLKWRAVSACARVVFPDVIQGMYTPEEMGAEVSENSSGDLVIETPASVIPADFTKTEEAVARLAANVDSDGVIEGEMVSESNEKPPSSDAAQKDIPTIRIKEFDALKVKPTVTYTDKIVRYTFHDTDAGKYHIYFGEMFDAENGFQWMDGNTLLVVTDPITPEVAKAKLAGNGAPANGEKKVIGKDTKTVVPGWKDTAQNTTAVFKAVRPLYKATEHMQNSIALMEKTGQLTNDMNVELAIRVITNHKDDTQAPF